MTQSKILTRSRTTIFIAGIASLIPSLAMLYYWRSQSVSTETTPPPVVQAKPVVRNVTSLGRVEPRGEIVTVSSSSGTRVGELLVEEGQQVQKGDLLAYLEDYDEKLAEKNLASSRLNEARQRYKSVTAYGEAQIAEAKTRIEQIKKPQSLEIKAQRASIKQLNAELKTAEKDYQRNQFLLGEGAVSEQTLDTNAVNFFSKEAELENAKALLEQLTEARKEDLNNAQAQLKSAEASLAQTQSEIELESSINSLELANASLERTIVRAPRSGRVIDIKTHSGEVVDEEGILELGDVEQMYVVAEVYESDIGKIKIGQPAEISDSSLPRKIQGVVESISQKISKNDILDNDPAADADSRVIEVKIRLQEEDSAVVSGLINLQVDVEIESNKEEVSQFPQEQTAIEESI